MAPTDKDLYVKRFSELERGVPLYPPSEVQIGDVGFIDTEDGLFQKLYNIANPPTNGEPGCPPLIKFETISHMEEWGVYHLKKSKGFRASPQVTTSNDPSQMQFVFPEVKRGECILIPGSIIVMERMEETGNLPKYMNDHLSWIVSTFTGSYRFSPQSLILIVRTLRTDRWAIAVNTSSEVVKIFLSFNIAPTADASVWGQSWWSASSLSSRSGPVSGKFLVPRKITGTHPKGIEGANQTIFVRHIALSPPVSYFGKSSFKPSGYSAPTTFERFRATVASSKSDLWAVEEPGDTQSLPAATSGAGSANIEEGNDKK